MPFVITATAFGPMLVNTLDGIEVEPGFMAGVGEELLQTGDYCGAENKMLLGIMELKRKYNGDGVVVIDVGANIGAHTIRWAKGMTGWGSVIAIEPQREVFYALCGNIALNNCHNVQAMRVAVCNKVGFGTIRVPSLDPMHRANYGGVSLIGRVNSNYDDVRAIRLNDIQDTYPPRIDVIKLDVEGMETVVIDSGDIVIPLFKPVIYAEYNICGLDEIKSRLPGYKFFVADSQNVLCVHEADPILQDIQ